MADKKLVEIGKKKFEEDLQKHSLGRQEFSDDVLEVFGATKVRYYGTSELMDIKNKDNDIERGIFYRYTDFELKECSLGVAINTPEYIKDKIIIFSEEPEAERIFYITKILD